jgi:hypothetical protein
LIWINILKLSKGGSLNGKQSPLMFDPPDKGIGTGFRVGKTGDVIDPRVAPAPARMNSIRTGLFTFNSPDKIKVGTGFQSWEKISKLIFCTFYNSGYSDSDNNMPLRWSGKKVGLILFYKHATPLELQNPGSSTQAYPLSPIPCRLSLAQKLHV